MKAHPGDVIPGFKIAMTDGKTLRLPADLRSSKLTLLVVYRGLHCGICKGYLTELASRKDELSALGVDVIAVSADPAGKARQAQAEWTDNRIRMGYGLTEQEGKLLGLFMSAKRKDGEPERFFEPGMYLLDSAGKLLFIAVQNMPFGRPGIPEMVSRIEWMLDNQVPPRGTLNY